MRTISGKIECISAALLLALFAALAVPAPAQDKKPAGKAKAAKGGGAPAGSGEKAGDAGKAAGAADTGESSADTATTSALDYLFNRKPQDGSTADRGTTAADMLSTKAIADDALADVSSDTDPAFESFLNSPEQNQELVEAYHTLLDETVQHLREKEPYDAIANLYVLGRYTWDSRVSEQLANRVMALRDAKLSQQDLERGNAELEGKIQKANRNADMIAERVREDEMEYQRRQSAKSRKLKQQQEQNNNQQQNNRNAAFLPNPEQSQQAVSSVMGRLQLSEEYFKSLDSRARIRLQEQEIEQIEKKARKDFQDFIGVLYEGQRHHHARLGADFYRILFGDGDLPAEMASQATAASEIIQRIANDVEVFKYKSEKGQIAGATKILQEAFALSRNHPALRTVSRVEKLEVADYLAELQKLHNMIEARDFGNLEKALSRLEETVEDFDATKPRALVNAVKRESDMRLGMAKMAAQQGELRSCQNQDTGILSWPLI